ncbi:hypothetical protein K227x_54460 [Rubripirellula lacrimiformis]|uniref:Uncharacterized protein n=1 Tax=Rubripirellula lacrimiformis TaxID=1930273 RepID=A0A517NIR2_9BACT|nr:hypothetical protein K227x_54460 [Rubripirellula lacrimiformis]
MNHLLRIDVVAVVEYPNDGLGRVRGLSEFRFQQAAVLYTRSGYLVLWGHCFGVQWLRTQVASSFSNIARMSGQLNPMAIGIAHNSAPAPWRRFGRTDDFAPLQVTDRARCGCICSPTNLSAFVSNISPNIGTTPKSRIAPPIRRETRMTQLAITQETYLFPDTPETVSDFQAIVTTFQQKMGCRKGHQDE